MKPQKTNLKKEIYKKKGNNKEKCHKKIFYLSKNYFLFVRAKYKFGLGNSGNQKIVRKNIGHVCTVEKPNQVLSFINDSIVISFNSTYGS